MLTRFIYRYPNLVLMDATYKTCKLLLPLFFLVVRTNVGYSVIAEFVVQHEDSESIAEALGLLRAQWDANNIQVANFMIDCQQSEENVIRGMFPDSVIYLCSFHHLQALVGERQEWGSQLPRPTYGSPESCWRIQDRGRVHEESDTLAEIAHVV